MKTLLETLKLVREGWRAQRESWDYHYIYWHEGEKTIFLSDGEEHSEFEWVGFDEDFFKKEDWEIIGESP